MLTNWITKKFLSSIWLFENVLWKYSDLVAINQEKENIKKILYEVYWYKDIYDFIPKKLDNDSVDKFLKTMFTYYDTPKENDIK